MTTYPSLENKQNDTLAEKKARAKTLAGMGALVIAVSVVGAPVAAMGAVAIAAQEKHYQPLRSPQLSITQRSLKRT